MLNELEQLSLTLDTLTNSEAEQVINSVNKILVSMLNPHIIDVLWKEEGKNGVILRPFCSWDKSKRGGAKPYQVGEGPTGIWTWVYKYGKSVWLENVKNLDVSKSARNLADGEDIDPIYLDIFKDTDSIIAAPLIFRDVLSGVYSIELPISGRFTKEILDLIERIARPIATIVWKADAHAINKNHTSKAIRIFSETILDYGIQEILNPYRCGFIARPFTREFNNFEKYIRELLKRHNIRARRFVYRQGKGIMVEDIMNQIRTSHFGIVDITGYNPNVMMELGMFMVLRKKFIVLRQKDDKSNLPFDIRPFHVTDYMIQEEKINCYDPIDERYQPIEMILDAFLSELYNDPKFVSAKPWTSTRDEKIFRNEGE